MSGLWFLVLPLIILSVHVFMWAYRRHRTVPAPSGHPAPRPWRFHRATGHQPATALPVPDGPLWRDQSPPQPAPRQLLLPGHFELFNRGVCLLRRLGALLLRAHLLDELLALVALLGTGGAPEGVLAAAALRCIGGQMQCRLILDSEEKRERAHKILALGERAAEVATEIHRLSHALHSAKLDALGLDRALGLAGHLLRNRCSYLIYSEAFDALPGPVRAYVLERLWKVLTGRDRGKEFAHLSAADRKAIGPATRAVLIGADSRARARLEVEGVVLDDDGIDVVVADRPPPPRRASISFWESVSEATDYWMTNCGK